jgi:hypothetical protein
VRGGCETSTTAKSLRKKNEVRTCFLRHILDYSILVQK